MILLHLHFLIYTSCFNFVGFYFIPGALSTEQQCFWIRESLKTFPQPPNRTNLTALYGPIFDLLTAAKNQKVLLEVQNSDGQESNERSNSGEKTRSINFKFVEHSKIEKGETRRSTTATTLVRKLRWSTLGLQFDWSKVCTLLFHRSAKNYIYFLTFISPFAFNDFSLAF
jgi:alkylated DNA repair protein alkB family protein 1